MNHGVASRTLIRTVLLTIGLLKCHSSGFCQQRPAKTKVYDVSISKVDRSPIIKGSLVDVLDSSIVVQSINEQIVIPCGAIKSIRIYARGHTGRGAFYGLMAGVLVGGGIGFIAGDDDKCPQGSIFCNEETAGQKGLRGAVIGGIIGTTLGLIIGGATKAENLLMHGDAVVFEENRSVLEKYQMPPSFDR